MHGNGQHVTNPTTTQPQPQQPPQYQVTHDFDGSAELTTTIVHAISDIAGIDVSRTEGTLSDSVDPDALNRIFAPNADGTPRTNARITFTLWDHQVTVEGNGQITIVPPHPQQVAQW